MLELTRRQDEILALIRQYIYEEGYPPTRAEIAEAFGFRSANAAEEHLRALERKGVIELLQGSSPGIRLLEDGEEEEGIPVVGRVAAGEPILAEQHIEDRYPVDPALFHPRAHYLLRVRGMRRSGDGTFSQRRGFPRGSGVYGQEAWARGWGSRSGEYGAGFGCGMWDGQF